MSERVLPNVIPHPPHDHRLVQTSELLALKLYDHLMGRPFWTIVDYASAPNFLKSTSKWSEQHLIAFRCLLLENLPVSRIVPLAELVGDDDPSMKLVDKHLLATEREVRSGDAERGLGPASSFYQQLQAVIRRPPSPPEPIAIPRTYRPTTLSAVFSTIPESHGSTTSDESYQPSPPTRQSASSVRHSGEWSDTRPRSSMESIRSQDSMAEDKLEELANQAAATLLGLLCTFQELAFPDDATRLRFSREPFVPTLVIHGETLSSYNDGSYFLERRSRHRPHEWVVQDSYPRASLECKRKKHTRKELIQAQELGEILAIGHNRYVNSKWDEKDREVYLVGIHHDRMYVTAAEFPSQYFQWVQDDRIPAGECLVMRRSSLFDLSKPESRREACRLILTVMRRIMK